MMYITIFRYRTVPVFTPMIIISAVIILTLRPYLLTMLQLLVLLCMAVVKGLELLGSGVRTVAFEISKSLVTIVINVDALLRCAASDPLDTTPNEMPLTDFANRIHFKVMGINVPPYDGALKRC